MLENTAPLPEGVTYLNYRDQYVQGVAPVQGWGVNWCGAMLALWITGDTGGGATWDLTCTRPPGHPDRLHVAHTSPGIPLAGWYNDPTIPTTPKD